MKLQQIGSNQTAITKDNGNTVFFSYNTPVAAHVPGRGYLRTAEKFSRTTSKHITQWAGSGATVVPQSEIEKIANS